MPVKFLHSTSSEGSDARQADRKMGLAAAHGLFQLEYSLFAFTFQSPEGMLKQGFHSFGDIVLSKKFFRFDAVIYEIRQIQNCIPSLGIEDAVTGRTEFH